LLIANTDIKISRLKIKKNQLESVVKLVIEIFEVFNEHDDNTSVDS